MPDKADFYCWNCPHEWIGVYTIPKDVRCPRCNGTSLISIALGHETIILIDNESDMERAKTWVDNADLLNDTDDLINEIGELCALN